MVSECLLKAMEHRLAEHLQKATAAKAAAAALIRRGVATGQLMPAHSHGKLAG
jgi:hypothetical protein